MWRAESDSGFRAVSLVASLLHQTVSFPQLMSASAGEEKQEIIDEHQW